MPASQHAQPPLEPLREQSQQLSSLSSQHQPMSANTSFWDLKLQGLKAANQQGQISNSSKSHSRVILPKGFKKFLPLERKKVGDKYCASAQPPARQFQHLQEQQQRREGTRVYDCLAEGNSFSPENKWAMPSLPRLIRSHVLVHIKAQAFFHSQWSLSSSVCNGRVIDILPVTDFLNQSQCLCLYPILSPAMCQRWHRQSQLSPAILLGNAIYPCPIPACPSSQCSQAPCLPSTMPQG